MTSWSDFLAELRADLQDEPATLSAKPRWSDRMLWIYTKDALRDYSTWFPKRLDRVGIAAINGAFPLPANFIEEIFVEFPKDTFLEKRLERPGTRQRPIFLTQHYFIQGGSIYLNTVPLDGVILLLTYLGTHDVPVTEHDIATDAVPAILDVDGNIVTPAVPAYAGFSFSIPDADIELPRIYVKAQVYTQMRSRQASLDRFKVGNGARDDNPLLPEVNEEMKNYYEKIADRTRGGTIQLYRMGRQK